MALYTNKTRVFYKADCTLHEKTRVIYKADGTLLETNRVFYKADCTLQRQAVPASQGLASQRQPTPRKKVKK